MSRGNTKTGRLALKENPGRCLAHHDKSCGFDGAAKDGQQPERPAPAVTSCKKATDNGAKHLHTHHFSVPNCEGKIISLQVLPRAPN